MALFLRDLLRGGLTARCKVTSYVILRENYMSELKRSNSWSFEMQSYLVSLFLDCPAGMGLHCPNATAVRAVEDAIRDGTITWHAFPHNAQVRAVPVLRFCTHFGVQVLS